jgi:hypothetical protein
MGQGRVRVIHNFLTGVGIEDWGLGLGTEDWGLRTELAAVLFLFLLLFLFLNFLE